MGKLQPWHLQGGVRRSAWLPVEFQRVKKLVQEIKEAGGEAIFVQTDVSKAAQVQTLIEKTVEEYGRLDCAFNNAGIEGPHFVPLTDYSEEDWDQLMDINLKGVWLCMKYAIPHMLKQSKGAIVNMSSVTGLIGGRSGAPYCASKHGVIGLTKAVALEYATQGIRVNAVCPAVIQTEMAERLFFSDPEIAKRVPGLHPMGRAGTVEEVAEVVVWLCSDAASFVTGHALPIDGGMIAQ